LSIVVCCNLPDGIIVGADSAGTIRGTVSEPGGGVQHPVLKVYTGVQKLFRFDDYLIGFYGAGMFGQRTIGSLLREPRGRPGVGGKKPSLKKEATYWQKALQAKYDEAVQMGQQAGSLGLVLAGYSPGRPLGEVWHVEVPKVSGRIPVQCRRTEGNFGMECFALAAPIYRLMYGYDPPAIIAVLKYVVGFLKEKGASLPDTVVTELCKGVLGVLAQGEYPIPFAQMPLGQGIRYVRALLDVVIEMAAFALGPEVCDRPIALAVATGEGRTSWIEAPLVERLAEGGERL
jgi:hypothetical protein